MAPAENPSNFAQYLDDMQSINTASLSELLSIIIQLREGVNKLSIQLLKAAGEERILLIWRMLLLSNKSSKVINWQFCDEGNDRLWYLGMKFHQQEIFVWISLNKPVSENLTSEFCQKKKALRLSFQDNFSHVLSLLFTPCVEVL